MKLKALFSLTLIAIIITSIFSPAVMASTVYGPVQYEQGKGKPVEVSDIFSLNDTNGNYTLFLKNSDGEINRSSRASVLLNEEPVVRPEDFKQKIGLIRSLSLAADSLKNVDLIRKNVSLEAENNLNIKMKSAPGSQFTLWIEDKSPLIKIISPFGDTVSNGTVNVSGYIDPLIRSGINLTLNGITSPLPVENGTFSTEVNLTETTNGTANITISGTDLAGRIHSATLLLDGDMLPASEEYQLGFDPLNPDSNSTLSPDNLAGNGIPDGLEVLNKTNGEILPVLVKHLINGDPTKVDSNGNNLTDYFEYAELHILNVSDNSTEAMTLPNEDPDQDGLTNLQEQSLGMDPLNPDTDEDGLTDGYEVNTSHTDPHSRDMDNDGLDDAAELKLGTNSNNSDTNGNGIPDGNETFTTTAVSPDLGINLSITGTGDLAKEVVIHEDTSELLTNISALVSPVVDFSLDNRTFENAQVTIPYDPAKVPDPTNLSMFCFNESAGTFESIASTVDRTKHTVTGTASHFSTFAIFYVPTWNSLFEADMKLGREDGEVDVVYVDVMFTIDSSGSMSSNDPYGYRKTAARNFVGALLPGDRAGVVDFDSSARLIRPLTSNFNAVNASINSLDASGGTNIGAGMSTANSHLISSGNQEHAWMVILLTDGQGSYSDSYTQQAVNNNITVYTIGLGSGVNSALLTNIATSTGGQYFPVSSANDLPNVFRTISQEIDTTDSDEDGLLNITETSGFRDGSGKWYYTDPNNNDTDEDGLTDGEEAGQLLTNPDGKKYYNVISDPTKVDGDDDSLTDYEEVHGNIIHVANTRDSAVDFILSLQQGTDPTQHLTAINAISDPMKTDSDDDGIDDGDEIAMGTNPNNDDTDGDHIKDNLESFAGEDPTIFDLTPPVITYDEPKVWNEGLTLKYYFDYGAHDYAGVKDLSLLKNSIKKDGYIYPPGQNRVNETTYFETDWETFLDGLRGAQVTIDADDWNNNSESVMAYYRPDQFAIWAAQLGSDTIANEAIAGDLGMLSGCAVVIGEIPEFAIQFLNDPAGYLNAIKNLIFSIKDDPTLLGQLIASLPQSVKDRQELENPYLDEDPLRNSFAGGWYLGYIGMSLATTYLGSAAMKSIKSSGEFAQVMNGLVQKMDRVKAFLKVTKRLDSFALFLADETASVDLFAKVKTAAMKARVKKCIENINPDKLAQVNSYAVDMGEFLARTGDDGVNFINSVNLDDDLLQKMFSISSPKLTTDLISDLRVNLVKLNKEGVSKDEIKSFIEHTDTLKDVEGYNRVVERVSAGDAVNFKGAAFEAEYAATTGNAEDIIEMGAKSGVSQPGEIDLIRRENGQNVAYELKNIDFNPNNWENNLKNKFGNQNAGLKSLVNNKTPVNGNIIDSYKFVFKEQPPTYVIEWLEQKSVPYEVFLEVA